MENVEEKRISLLYDENYIFLTTLLIEFSQRNNINTEDLVDYIINKLGLTINDPTDVYELIDLGVFKTITQVIEDLGLDKLKTLVPYPDKFQLTILHIYKHQYVFPIIKNIIGDDKLSEIYSEKNEELMSKIENLISRHQKKFVINIRTQEDESNENMHKPALFATKGFLSKLADESDFSVYYKVVHNDNPYSDLYDEIFYNSQVFSRIGNMCNNKIFQMKIGNTPEEGFSITNISSEISFFNNPNNDPKHSPNFIIRSPFEALELTIFVVIFMHNPKFDFNSMFQ